MPLPTPSCQGIVWTAGLLPEAWYQVCLGVPAVVQLSHPTAT